MIKNLELLKAQVNIVDVVERYLDLHKAGSSLKACCPFHDEKSASFMISSSKNIYKCFGCGASGDAFKFLQEYKKLSFKESIEEIASLYKFPLEYESNEKFEYNQKLIEILSYANELFKQRLLKEPIVLSYLTNKRNISLETIQAYDLGFCVNEDLEKLKKRFSQSELLDSGLFNNHNEKKELKSFCNYRITIPLKDSKGKIRSFSARSCVARMLALKDSAKYINGRDTKIFKKSYILFNYSKAYNEILKRKQVIICEGFFDVMGYEFFNYPNAICCIGTAFTKEHLSLISKLGVEICFSLDNDLAGIQASIRALELCFNLGVTNVSVIKIKDKEFKDLGEFLEQNKRPNLVKIYGFKFYCAFLLREQLCPKDKDANYKKILHIIKDLSPFIKGEFEVILNSFLPTISKKKTTQKPPISLLEARIYKTMIESEEFRYIASRHLSPSDVEYKEIFKKILLNDFSGLDFLNAYKSLKEIHYTSSLVEMKLKGLNASLKAALENKDYALVSALKNKIKELQLPF
ncbi:DNA primase [Helicobacter cetorum]|uniref:DNA primase n=1 Tax=Helicobacter cetorum TaxID=138563 RepID=UPI000CF0DFB6|nr:DNA primase [Helicobacter cetorum]